MSVFKMALLVACIVAPVLGPVAAGPIPQDAPRIANTVIQTQSPADGFAQWRSDFRTRALDLGISASIFDRAFAGVTYDAAIVERDRNQSEFSKTLWEYLDTAVSDYRIRNGRAALAEYGDVLDRIEATYGVEKEIVVAVWGLESAFGAVRGDTDVIEAMATLAYEGRRADFFETQLIAALRIVQEGATAPRNMVGSWAGAMGHTQFMPTSFMEYAVDGNGDGRRDIWGDDPTDALASTANYLRAFGWSSGLPWGVEVQLPDDFPYVMARRDNFRSPSLWARDGVVDMNGNPVPDYGPATILLPGGHEGAAIMIFTNFEVLETYNTADSYVIAVGHLADRIAGGGPIEAEWPRGDRALTFAERIEMQEHLTAAGFDTQKIDGLVGPLTINAIRLYQQSIGWVPDGYASPRLLENLRR